MQQNIDTYFKEKLLDREFDMQAKYWQEAVALLDATEKKKRRGILLFWFGGLMPMLGIALYFILQNGVPPTSSTSIDQVQSVENEQVAVSPKKDENAIVASSNSASQNLDKPFPQKNKTSVIGTKKNGLPLPTASATSTIYQNDFTKSDGMNSGMMEELNEETLPVENLSARDEAPDLLSQLLVYVEADFDKTPQTKNLCLQPSPFHFGVSVAQLMQAAPRGNESLVTGFYSGVVFQYDLNKNWFVSSGIGYMRRDGHFEASKMTEMRNYRFGLELMESLLRPTSLHYLSMPLSVGWKKGHNLFEGGLMIDYLTGVRGEIGKLERVGTDQPTKEFVAYEKAWIKEEGFTRLNLTPTVGYRYRVNKELSFGLSAQFNLRPLTNKEPAIGDYILKEDDRFNVRLNAVYLLK